MTKALSLAVGGLRAGRSIWTAGVEPSPTGHWLRVPMNRAGRVRVQPDLTIPGHPEVFVIGDVAALEQDGRSLPGVAQVAIQQGRYAARAIERQLVRKPPQPPFRYFDKGNMAVVVDLRCSRAAGPRSAAFWHSLHGAPSTCNTLRKRGCARWSSCNGCGCM